MAERAYFRPFLQPLRDLETWLRANNFEAVLIGGLAVSLIGRPRATRDIDLLLLAPEDQWVRLLDTAGQFGFTARQTDSLGYAFANRVILLTHEASSIEIDISMGLLPFEKQLFKRSSSIRFEDLLVRVSSAEDLIVMKAIAHRPRDLVDIEGLLATHPKLNVRRIRTYLKQFNALMEATEPLEAFESLLRDYRKRSKKKRTK